MKLTVLTKRLVQIVLHSIFWIAVYLFYTYFLGYGSKNVAYVNKFSFFLMPVTMATSYFFMFFLIPKYLLEKKQLYFILYSIYTFIISSFLIVLSILYGLVFSLELTKENTAPLTRTFPFIILGVYMVVLVMIVVGLVFHNYKTAIKNEDLKNKFLQTQLQLKEQELKFLKMQIHPHFLFNSLNTIYGFALQKGEEAPEMILKLSNLLDYILYQIEKPKVLLEEEINHLEDYIALEKMRFHDTLHVSFTKEIEQENIQTSPMLLIPFVENSFKHGSLKEGILQINITLKVLNNHLFFTIKNFWNNESIETNGIGIDNIKKRLEMLYPKKHQLKINTENGTFDVTLKVNLETRKAK